MKYLRYLIAFLFGNKDIELLVVKATDTGLLLIPVNDTISWKYSSKNYHLSHISKDLDLTLMFATLKPYAQIMESMFTMHEEHIFQWRPRQFFNKYIAAMTAFGKYEIKNQSLYAQMIKTLASNFGFVYIRIS